MVNVGDLVVKLTADTGQFDKGISGIVDKLGGFGTIGVVGAVTAAGAAIGAFASQSITAFTSLDTKMREVFTLLPGISDEAMRDMTDQVLDFSAEFGVLPDDVVPALYNSLSAGIPPDNVFEFLEVANQAAVGGVTDLNTAVDGLTSVVNAYGADVISTAEASDQMFTAVRLGKTTFEELAGGIGGVAPLASAVGVEFGELMAATAALTAQGIATSQAFTGMRAVISNIVQPASNAKEEWLGINRALIENGQVTGPVVDEFLHLEVAIERVWEQAREAVAAGADYDETMKNAADSAKDLRNMQNDMVPALNEVSLQQVGLAGITAELANQTGGSTAAMAKYFGSIEALNAVLALTSESGSESFLSALEDMQNAGGATEEAFNVMRDGIQHSLDRLSALMNVFLNNVGMRLAPTFQRAVDTIVRVLPGFQAIVLNALDSIMAVVDRVSTFIANAFEFIAFTFLDTANSVGGNSESLQETMRRAFEAIGNLIKAVFGLISASWETILKPTFEAIAPLVSGVFHVVKTVVMAAVEILIFTFNALAALLSGDFAGAWEYVQQIVTVVVKTIKEVAQTVFNALLAYFTNVLGLTKTSFMTAWQNIKEFLTGIFAGIGVDANMVFDALAQYFNAVLTGIQNVFESVWNLIKAVLTGNWDDTRDAAIAVWTAIQEYFTSVLAGVLGVFTAVWGEIKAFVTANWDDIAAAAEFVWNQIEGYFSTVLDVIRTVFETVWTAIKDFVTGIFGDIFTSASDRFSAVREAIMGAFTGIVEFVGGILGGVVEVFQNAISSITSTIDTVRGAIGAVQETVGGLTESATAAVTGAGEAIGNWWSNLFGGSEDAPPMPDFQMPVPVGPLPGFAAGGLVRGPTLAMVGEAGPELVTPLDRLSEFMGGGEQTIIVELDGRAIMQSVAPRMIDQVRLRTGLVNY